MFYFEDHYPDSHLFADAERLRQAHDPDFLYVHSMNIDDAGHKHGGESKEYELAVRIADSLLAMLVPLWRSVGYSVMVTSDHGMSANGQHGGTTAEERRVPLYLAGESLPERDEADALPQLAIAPLMCRCLGLAPSPSMNEADRMLPLEEGRVWDDEG
jgi:predicted AlkP superfamily pyrophosphatase or phosphodiesterase